MTACGQCYPFAYQEALKWLLLPSRERPKLRVVHGIVVDPWDGHDIAHAWIESRGYAYDWQTIVARGEQPIPIAKFREIWQPHSMTRYTPREVIRNTLRFNHYGPWA